VGLGNPGSQYAKTRHNAGFWFVDKLAEKAGQVFRPQARFFGELCELEMEGNRLRLLKPATFMNRSGQAVAAVAGFFRLPAQTLLVVHDEIDLAVGTLRLKRGGGHGGHNGLRDIIAQLGSAEFLRLRIGVGHPGNAGQVVDYVLQRAPLDQQRLLDLAIDEALGVFPKIVQGEIEMAMNELHRRSGRANCEDKTVGI
jgi:PTH1 family peptidyl-tRNA hydrolase